MERTRVTKEEIEKVLRDIFQPKRSVKLFTGAGGMDLFEESLENQCGLQRVYIGHKIPRILRRLKGRIHKSLTKGYYKNIPL